MCNHFHCDLIQMAGKKEHKLKYGVEEEEEENEK